MTIQESVNCDPDVVHLRPGHVVDDYHATNTDNCKSENEIANGTYWTMVAIDEQDVAAVLRKVCQGTSRAVADKRAEVVRRSYSLRKSVCLLRIPLAARFATPGWRYIPRVNADCCRPTVGEYVAYHPQQRALAVPNADLDILQWIAGTRQEEFLKRLFAVILNEPMTPWTTTLVPVR
jgi:hypothetical protein